MIYLLLVPFALLILWGAIRYARKEKGEEVSWETLAITIGCIAAFTLILTCSLTTMANGAGLEKWKAFYEANSQNYAIAVDETSAILSTEKYVESALIPVEGSIEKWSQGKVVSQRIVEWRDAVNQYNTTIASMKYFNRNPLTGVLIPNGVEDMKLLIIE